MAAEIRKQRPQANVEIVGESDQLGMFNVVANGRPLWNKHQMGGFPEPEAIIAQVPRAPAS